jgi:Skp family chaperone for outer membrane proteins
MKRYFLARLSVALALTGSAASAAQTQDSYAADLGRVYGGYQRMLAMKEACDTAVPAARAANDKAFAIWQTQHGPLIQDLQRRVKAMVQAASTDKDDYVRNVGKYEGAILLERKEYRDTLLGLGADELRAQCQRMPEMLKGPAADLAQVYAAELATIRKRK